MALATVMLVPGVCLAWGDVRLNLHGVTLRGRFLGRWSSGRGSAPCHYNYDVDRRTYEVGGNCGVGDSPLIDVLRSDPGVARLHKDAGEGLKFAGLFAFFGFGMVGLSLVERRDHLRSQGLGERPKSPSAISKGR